MLEPRSFYVCRNATAPIIVILGHLELDMKVLDAGIETVKSNDCRGISRDDRDTNDILAAMQEGARFFCKDRWNFINPIV